MTESISLFCDLIINEIGEVVVQHIKLGRENTSYEAPSLFISFSRSDRDVCDAFGNRIQQNIFLLMKPSHCISIYLEGNMYE